MDQPPILVRLTQQELRELSRAKALLENPGLTARLAGAVGRPIEQGFKLLPAGWQNVVHKAAKAALLAALNAAVTTLNGRPSPRAANGFHKFLVGASGGLGGAFGLASLPVELPVSTTLMLRSIADVARSEGHDLRLAETKLACLEVFALGGRSSTDDAADSAYWGVRTALAKAVSEAASYLTEKAVLEESAPAVLRLVTAIASRFGVVVSEQTAAKAVPVLGAAGGAIVNVLFMNHFQDMARGHFIVRRLEQKYGSAVVRRTYESIAVPC
ncbi:MAG TPA: EcsC family protein [Verrucomicrobiae bacterium]|nr:EcsC family protein [Verrucomicrobiae bacterium]